MVISKTYDLFDMFLLRNEQKLKNLTGFRFLFILVLHKFNKKEIARREREDFQNFGGKIVAETDSTYSSIHALFFFIFCNMK